MKHLKPITLVSMLFSASAITSSAAALVYESFDYSAGTVNGTQAGGTGFATASAWNGSTSNVPFSVTAGNLGFGSLSTTGGAVDRTSAPGGAEISRTLDATVASSLTGSTAYFSALVSTDYFSVGNENLGFAFGTSDVLAHGNQPITSSGSGEALGFALDGNLTVTDKIDFGASAFGGAANAVPAFNGYGFSTDTVVMLVGSIEWNASAGSDLVTIYAASGGVDGTTGSTDWSSFASIGTITADYTEANFDTIHIAGQQISSVDEIRMGLSLEDVGVTGVVPEPSTTALLGLGGLALILRRRK